jgi:hypothetical protein
VRHSEPYASFQYCPYSILSDIFLDLIYMRMQTQRPRRKRAIDKLRVSGEAKMRKSLWILSLLLVTIGAAPAHADSFTITLFDGTTTTVDGTGSFDFSGGTFSDFTITMFPGTVNAITFDMTSAANSAPSEFHGCDGGLSISIFTYLTNANCQNGGSTPGDAWAYAGQDTAPAVLGFNTVVGNPIFASATGPHLGGQFDGDFAVTEPEPGMMLLLLTGLIALALFARTRNVRGLKATS